MQDLRWMTSGGSGGGRICGGERRLRPYPNQPLKCPRCDSLNTKFCYYNNYNLSQPRHFCKSCRRYWTKGGVLRNVPVGGGCRKTKRSKPKPSSELQKERKSSTSYSSSESSSLTAATTNATTTEAMKETFPDSLLLAASQPPNPSFEPSILDNLEKASSDCGIFTTDGGNLTSLMSEPNPAMVGFNFSSEISPFRLHHHQQQQHHEEQQEMEQIESQQEKMMMMEELKMQEITVGLPMPGFQKRPAASNRELTVSEWQLGNEDDHHGGFLDLPSTVDHGYWNQSHWVSIDQNFYIP